MWLDWFFGKEEIEYLEPISFETETFFSISWKYAVECKPFYFFWGYTDKWFERYFPEMK